MTLFLQSVGHKGQKRHIASALDRGIQFALMQRASAGYAARQNLSAFADEFAEFRAVLIVDERDLVCTENANLFSSAVYRRTSYREIEFSLYQPKTYLKDFE